MPIIALRLIFRLHTPNSNDKSPEELPIPIFNTRGVFASLLSLGTGFQLQLGNQFLVGRNRLSLLDWYWSGGRERGGGKTVFSVTRVSRFRH